jgi:NTP pyrophosphatase (non-canonical NTP hydrolase)
MTKKLIYYNNNQLYNYAITKWGVSTQINMAIEECSELITKLIKYNRKNNGSTKQEIIDEIADVMIMCEQLRLIFGYNEVEFRKNKKLNRLEKRLREL